MKHQINKIILCIKLKLVVEQVIIIKNNFEYKIDTAKKLNINFTY